MSLILIGFMGSGKTSVAKELASCLAYPVLEMDQLVLEKTGTKSMSELFAKGGELLLRQTELRIAQELIQDQPLIISTGAGVVLNKLVIDYLKKDRGKIFFLNASFETIVGRLVDDTSRPLFSSIEQARALYSFRQSLYVEYADYQIEVDHKELAQIAHEICLKGKYGQ